MSLTKEETEELEALEKEEKDRLAAEAVAAKRQHLDALRLAKRLTAKHGKPGHDFVVLETKVGNIAIRRPMDVEIDMIDEGADRATLEKFAVPIVIEPPTDELQKLMAEHHGLVGAIFASSMKLLRATREDDEKK